MAERASDASGSSGLRLRTDELADRLTRAIGSIALSTLFACGAKPNTAPPAVSDVMALASKTTAASRGFERYYRAENSGVADAYLERALRAGRAIGPTETCLLPTGAASTRTTVLANPPLSPAAIRQRQALVAAIGAYASTLAAVAEGSSADVISASLIYSKSRAVALQKAASVHAAGDLFIVDESSEFANAIARIERDGTKDASRRQLERADAIARSLGTIAATDLARQRRESIDATTLAYETWSLRAGGASGPSQLNELPFCSEPAIFHRPASRTSRLTSTGALRARGVRLRERMLAIRRANPGAVLLALAALEEAEMRLLASSGNALQSREAAVTRDRLEQVCEHFANASSAFEPAKRE